MAGNSQRRGAVRRQGSKKGATVGSGGQSRKGLQGRGPTPRAADRPHHPAARRARRQDAGPAAESKQSRPQASTGPSSRPRSRADGGPELVGGRNPVLEALQAGVPARVLYVAARIDADDRVREALKLAADRGLPVMEATRTELDRLGSGGVHQGLLLAVPAYRYAHPDDLLAAAERTGRPPLLVALDGVTDPRNLGATVRSAGAFGAHGVVVPSRRAAGMTASAWKASAGAAARVPVARATNLTRALLDLRRAGCFVVGLDAAAGTPLPDLDPALVTGPLVLVAGSEGKGLSRLVRETCDVLAAIPIAATTESLNASVAAGIALYEVARRRPS